MDSETRELIKKLHEKTFSQAETTGVPENKKDKYISIFLMYPYSQPIPPYFVKAVKEMLVKYTPNENILISMNEPQHGIKIEHITDLAKRADIGVALINPKNFNVFLEIGMMWGMKKDCVLLFWKDDPDKETVVPFDASSHLVVQFQDEETLKTELNKVIQKIILERNFIMNLTSFTKPQIDTSISKAPLSELKVKFDSVLSKLTKMDTDGEHYRYYIESVIASSSGDEKDYFIKRLTDKTLTEQDWPIKSEFFKILEDLSKGAALTDVYLQTIINYLLEDYRRITDWDIQYDIMSKLATFSSTMNAVQANKLASILIEKTTHTYYGFTAYNLGKQIATGHLNKLSEENTNALFPKT